MFPFGNSEPNQPIFVKEHIMQISRSIFTLYSGILVLLEYLCMINSSKTPYLSHSGSLCSTTVQPLSEMGCFFCSCLFKPPSWWAHCSHWLVSGSCPSEDFLQLQNLHQETVVVKFHLFLLFYFKYEPLKYTFTCSRRDRIWKRQCE